MLVFGDSITQGFWDRDGGWVQRIRKIYDGLGISGQDDDPPTVFNLGISADLTRNVLARFDHEAQARQRRRHELVFVFAIGINDTQLENGKELSSPEKYVNELTVLVKCAKKYSEKILFVGLTPVLEKLTVPVAWGDHVYTNARIQLFEAQLEQFCRVNRFPFVNVFDEFMKQSNDTDLLIDGLHPNDAGHELIAELVRPELEKLINQ